MVSLLLDSLKNFLSSGQIINHFLYVIDFSLFLVFFLEYFLFELLDVCWELVFSVKIKAKFFVEEDVVVTLMFDLLNFGYDRGPVLLWIGREGLSWWTAWVNGTDFEWLFWGGFDFIWGAWTGVLEVVMPRWFVIGWFDCWWLADGFEIFETEGALGLEDVGFGFGISNSMLINEPNW